jgi:acyl-coenzyme A synthetase/AMP-(fatty) acid ligase
MLQTSGTTNEPRIVMIGEENLHARAIGEVRDFRLTEADRILNHLSFSHDLGLNQVLSTLVAGGCLRIQTGPLILSLAKALNEYAPTGITGTPMMWVQLLNATKDQYPSLRYVTVSGGSLTAGVLRELQTVFPNATIIRTYGQTETFRTLMNKDSADLSQGQPLPGVKAFLVANGELVHSGEGEMLGYWQDEVSSLKKKTPEGIRTGDLFSRDSSGAFHYIGRNDDMLKRFEHRLNISEIEAAIVDLQMIAEVAVVSKPAPPSDPRQVLLAAFVRFADGSTIETSDLLRLLQQKLPSFKVPDRVIAIDEMPKTASFKTDRSLLQKRWMNEP